MFERIGQKLHHTKPGVKVNLLRILSTICDSSDERCGLLSRCGLLTAIRELQNDSRVLVRELAGQLVKSSEQSDVQVGTKRKSTIRRRSTSTTPPSLISSHSLPSSPQVIRSSASKVILEGRETPRRQNGINGSLVMSPGSRDGRSPIVVPGGPASGPSKPRLPRPMSHRLSQQSAQTSRPKEESQSPIPSTRPGSGAEPRRRRQTDARSGWT